MSILLLVLRVLLLLLLRLLAPGLQFVGGCFCVGPKLAIATTIVAADVAASC